MAHHAWKKYDYARSLANVRHPFQLTAGTFPEESLAGKKEIQSQAVELVFGLEDVS